MMRIIKVISVLDFFFFGIWNFSLFWNLLPKHPNIHKRDANAE